MRCFRSNSIICSGPAANTLNADKITVEQQKEMSGILRYHNGCSHCDHRLKAAALTRQLPSATNFEWISV
ncbi:hypothetical protein L596_026923 [Steinernema carpocapsae]|uniref:Uncharacterized protein n=1 Tax=Steinernema carpocapsae TaxID=34508 RepID=A0A4U5M2V1_STECR|nr:hypothetical protein L596_026923 [Steinernema carpocapsae]